MPDKFEVGSLCWAKMKGFAPWPGRVDNPPDTLKPSKKPGNCCIFFFGTNNYAWIEETQIKPYDEFKIQFSKTSNSSLKEAIVAIEEYIKGSSKTGHSSNFDDLLKDSGTEDDMNSANESPAKTPKIKKERKRKDSGNSSKKSTPQSAKRSRLTEPVVEAEERPILNHSPIKKPAASLLINRPSATIVQRKDIDVESVSQTLKEKNIKPSNLKFGFLGLGVIGSGIVKNLLNSGHSVVIWTRNHTKYEKFVLAGAYAAQTPSDVIEMCDITFSCVTDPTAVNDLVFGNCGVMAHMRPGKGYVEMTGIDPDTSLNIADAINGTGGRYLEAQIQGSRNQAEEGTLIILAAGDRNLFDDCQTCFEAMGKNSFFLGEVGNASRMSLILNMMTGISVAGLAEALALADRARVEQKDILEVFELTQTASPILIEKGKTILEGAFPTNQALSLMQKDLRLCLQLGDGIEQPLPLCATANEIFKHSKRLGYSDHDLSAIYIRARF